MAYAVALLAVGADGSQEAHWFKDFQTGDSPARRAGLQAVIDANPGTWVLAEFPTHAEYGQAAAIAFASAIAASASQLATLRANYLSFRTKFALFLRSSQVSTILTNAGSSGFTVAELQAFEAAVLRDV